MDGDHGGWMAEPGADAVLEVGADVAAGNDQAGDAMLDKDPSPGMGEGSMMELGSEAGGMLESGGMMESGGGMHGQGGGG